jgi:hypothetical protein
VPVAIIELAPFHLPFEAFQHGREVFPDESDFGVELIVEIEAVVVKEFLLREADAPASLTNSFHRSFQPRMTVWR